MRLTLTLFTLAVAPLIGIAACGAKTNKVQPNNSSHGNIQMASNDTPKRSTHQGRDFQTLDDYLAHLKRLGAQDYPFYELVEPNKYKLNIGRGGNRIPARYFTRDELKKKFGFNK